MSIKPTNPTRPDPTQNLGLGFVDWNFNFSLCLELDSGWYFCNNPCRAGTNLLANKNRWSFQPASDLELSQSQNKNLCRVDPRSFKGNPRYFPRFGLKWKFRKLQNCSILTTGAFKEKQTLDFLWFTFFP